MVASLSDAFLPDDVVLGGGNVRLLAALPRGARRGSSDDAFLGGVGALIRGYREWKAQRGWTAWQGAGWFLLLLMLVALALPGSAAFAG